MLRARIFTAIVLLGAFLGAVFYLPPAGWLVGSSLVSALAFWEWGALMKRSPRERVISATGAFAVCVAFGLAFPSIFFAAPAGPDAAVTQVIGRWFYWPAAVFWLLVVPVWLKRRWSLSNRLLGYATGVLVIFPFWGALTQLRQFGGLWLLSVMVVVWLADTAAYFTGRAFGRHKLAPAISPGKTWEGAVGGGAAVVLYGICVSSILPDVVRSSFPLLVISLLVLAATSIVGDLFESLLKRQAGLKDSSNLLPGHGGVLDRIDSLTSTLPLVALIWFNVGF
jgi:phosphatidate cytidylyltransferase